MSLPTLLDLPFLTACALGKGTFFLIFVNRITRCKRFKIGAYNFILILFRDPGLRGLKGWICGPCTGNNLCPVGERLVGCCSHVATAVYIACGVAFDPGWHRSTHVPGNLLHRGMPEMAEKALSEWVANDI